MVAVSKSQENVGFPWNSGVRHVTQLKLEAVRERESLCLRGMGLKSALENGRSARIRWRDDKQMADNKGDLALGTGAPQY